MSETRDIPVDDLASAVGDMQDALATGSLASSFKECSQPVRAGFSDNFTRAGSPHGGAWPARKDPRPKHPLLILSGDMYQAATSEYGSGHVESHGAREGEYGVDGSAIPYAAAQNFGYAPRNLPQREFLDVADDKADECMETLADGLMELVA